MSHLFDPIPAFGGHIQFPVAYKWNPTEILEFLGKVAANPATYHAPVAHKADFELLHSVIKALLPGGASYVKPTPEQQILRKDQKAPALEPTKKIPWTINNISEEYFIIFDLLGVFLSLMGPAPTTGTAPTAKNYFLPLVVVYAKWSSVLSRSKGFRPTIAQITWSIKDGKTYSFLGSSVGGFVKDQAWVDLVGKTRHAYLSGILKAPYTAYGQSPVRTENKGAGTNFGNCGETYPFLYVLADSTLKHNSSGISVVYAKITESEYKGENLWNDRSLWPPCDNCQQLMEWYGVKDRLPHFELWKS